jgi:hypothetical protein
MIEVQGIFGGGTMPTDDASSQTHATGRDAEIDHVLDRLRELPEPQALEFYNQLGPRLQWLARLRTTGRRRQALIAHHVGMAARACARVSVSDRGSR